MTLNANDIETILNRYFVLGERSPDIVQKEAPLMEVNDNVVDYLMATDNVHEEDYRVFSHFMNFETILDVGANFGYSVSSIWATGSNASIVSFEPIKQYESILRNIKMMNMKSSGGKNIFSRLFSKKKKRLYEYHMIGVSDESGKLEFVSPVVNDCIHSALTTAEKNPHIPSRFAISQST